MNVDLLCAASMICVEWANIIIIREYCKVKAERYLRVKNFDDEFSRFDTIPACDRQMSRRSELLYQYREYK